MRVIGVDPGLTRCGVGVVEVGADRRVRSVAGFVVRTPADADLGVRLWQLEQELEDLVNSHQPDAIAIERVFSQHNVRTMAGTAQAAGIAALIGTRRGIAVAFHTPTEVKASVTGSGTADKRQVAQMVSRIVNTKLVGPADMTDAIAIAICHAWRSPSQSRLAAAVRTGNGGGSL